MPQSNPGIFDTTRNELVSRPMRNSQPVEALLTKKSMFMHFLTNEASKKDVSNKISAGEFSTEEMFAFFAGFAALLEFGKQPEIEVLKGFLGSAAFRVKGNAHLLEFLKKNEVQDNEKIKAEILRSISGGV